MVVTAAATRTASAPFRAASLRDQLALPPRSHRSILPSVRAKRGHALFHAIVSMGAASVQACGGVTVDSSHADDRQGAGSRDGGEPTGAGGATGGAQSSSNTSGGSGNATTLFPSAGGDRGSYGYVDAGSEGGIAIGGVVPADGGPFGACAHSEQLSCAVWEPTPQGCSCNASAPLGPADCPSDSNLRFYCHSYTPQVGCYCTCVICIH
jgi:hypothetical protein